MKWHEVALLLLANDVLLWALSAWSKKQENAKLDRIAQEVLDQEDDEMNEKCKGVDWDEEAAALEATLISQKEIDKMSFAQAVLLNEWSANRIEKEK